MEIRQALSKVPDLIKGDFLLVRIRSLQDAVADLKEVGSSIKFSTQEVFESVSCSCFLVSYGNHQLLRNFRTYRNFAIASFKPLRK